MRPTTIIATFADGWRFAGRGWVCPAAIALATVLLAAVAQAADAEASLDQKADVVPPAQPRAVAVTSPDPLAGTEKIDPAVTSSVADDTVARLLPPRSDTAADWNAGLEPLHFCGEPRLLPTCVPPPPCHPALPPQPFDLVGMQGKPTAGPIYRGPCCPRTGSRDCGPCPRAHRLHDRAFDWFYSPRTPIFP
jgi:hypothetical protein